MCNNVLIKNKKGYKKTKLGWIPEDWEECCLKDITTIFGRIGFRGYTKEDIVQKNEGAISLSPTNIKNERICYDDNTYISNFKYEESPEIKIYDDDIIFVKTGSSYGKSAIIKNLPQKATINPQLIVFKDIKINRNILFNILNTNSFNRFLQKIVVAGAIPTLSQEQIYKYPITLPTKKEQEKIAEILSAWDDGIETLEKLIEQKEILKNSFAQKYFQRKNNLFQLKPYKLGELFTNRKETNCCDLELLSVCDGLGIIPRSQLNAKDNSNEDKSKYLKVCIGDLAYNTMRMWQGRCGVSSYEGIVSPAYTVCIPKDNIDVDYMYYLFQTSHMIHDFWRYSQGIVDDTLNLKFNNFEVIKVWIPDKETQTKIAKLLKSYDEEIQLLNSKLEKLKEQKKGLIQKLLTGQIRVKV